MLNEKGTESLYAKHKRPADVVLKGLINAAAVITVVIVVGIIAYILVKGIPHISWQFLTTDYSTLDQNRQGILPMILNTLYIVIITLLISVPVGICSAIYLTQYARKGRLVRAIDFTTEILAGIPSIIFGLFGYTVFCVMFRLQTSILAGSLTMVICILPTIIRTTEEALISVPSNYKEGAMALGAGKLRVIMGIVLPCAMPGVLTGVILAVGRIVGESAALLFTSGLGFNMPGKGASGAMDHIMESGRTLTLHLYTTAMDSTGPNTLNVAFATAAVLLILVFVLNRLASLASKALRKG